MTSFALSFFVSGGEEEAGKERTLPDFLSLKNNQNSSNTSEHPTSPGGGVKKFMLGHTVGCKNKKLHEIITG